MVYCMCGLRSSTAIAGLWCCKCSSSTCAIVQRAEKRPAEASQQLVHLVTAEVSQMSASNVHSAMQAVTELAKAVGAEGLVAGQMVDIKSEGLGTSIGVETLQYIHEHKTAALLEAAVVAGAIMGNAGALEILSLRKYAKCIGLAFQVCIPC